MNKVLIAITTILGSAAIPWQSKAEEGIVEFDVSEIVRTQPQHPTTEWHALFVSSPVVRTPLVNRTADSGATGFPSTEDCRSARVVLTGGFFSNDANGLSPAGLLIQNRIVKSANAGNWGSGGYLYNRNDKDFGFSRLIEGPPDDSMHAIQSKPFLIEDGKVSVFPINDAAWDRIAIGEAVFNDQRGLLIVSAISDMSKRQAVRQHVFAKSIELIAGYKNIFIKMMLNLDGAEGAFLKLPLSNRYYGTRKMRYISSVICLL